MVASSFLASSSLCYSQQRLYLLICFFPNHWTDGGFIREQFSWSGQNNGALIRVPPAATAGQRFLNSQHGTVASFMKCLWDEHRIATPKAFSCSHSSLKGNTAEDDACNAPSYWGDQHERVFLPGLGCVCLPHAICE